MTTTWMCHWFFIGVCSCVTVQRSEGQLLDLSSPVTATASSWYVINTKSLQIGFPPQMAIQADTGQVTNTCFLSKMESQPWFTIEFKSVISIFNVRLVVRAETFSYLPDNFVLRGMDNLSVYVSNSSTLGDRNQQRCDNPWKYISTNNILLDCGENRSGRFVHVTVPSATPTYLLICSIVFNRETGPLLPLDLSEVRATAVASGFDSSRPPMLTVDGVASSSEESCSSLTGADITWLRVDIQTVRYIREVRFLFYNGSATNSTIYVGRSLFKEGSRANTLCGTVTLSSDVIGSQWKNVTCTLPTLGQIIYIQRSSDSMQICEIEVFYDNILNIYSPVNITASSQKSANCPVWKPVDGVKGPSTPDSWISVASAKYSWWRIELQSRTVISRVVIYPRSLDGSKRTAMNGFSVYIGEYAIGNGSSNALCGQPWKAIETTEITINCLGNPVGKYLYVAAAAEPGATLFLSEISLYGCQEPNAMITGGVTHQALQRWQSTNLTCIGTTPGCNVTKVVWMSPDGNAIDTALEYILNGNLVSKIVVSGSTFGGLYTCSISYSGHSRSKTVEVAVNAEVNVLPLVVTVIDGNTADPLQCVTDGYPMPSITWKKNGVTIFHGVTDRLYHVVNRFGKDLRIGTVGLSDNGTVYTCEARQGSFVTNSSSILIVKSDVTFNSTPQSAVGVVGHKMTFTCETAGHSVEVTEWTVENKKVESGLVYEITSEQTGNNSTMTKLTIKRLQLSDGSLRYRCTAGTVTIPSLQVSDAATVFVLGVISSFLDKAYSLEETLTTQEPFSCVFTANPKPNAILQLNNTDVAGISVESKGPNEYNISLSVKDRIVMATGIYSCVVSYSESSVNITSTARLQVLPSVTLTPEVAVNITTPMTIRLKCIAVGYPLPIVTWSRTVGPDVVNVTNSSSSAVDYANRQTVSTLTYKYAYLNEAGDHTCLASSTLNNGMPVTSLSSPTSVQASAKISSQVSSVEAVWGSSTKLTCVATGYPSPVVAWKFGDNTIRQGVTTTKSTVASSSYLYLTNLHAVSHGGQYKCEADNVAGPPDSVAFNITFKPQVVVPPTSVGVIYGEELTLKCAIASFPAVGHVIWYKNGERILSHSDIVVSKNQTAITSRYSVQSATEAACGNYSCYNVTSQTATVTVSGEAFLDTGSISLVEGETVTFNCTAVGCPTPLITWQFSGIGNSRFTEVDADLHVQVQSHVINSTRSYSVLTITNADRTIHGSFRCIANNGVQKTSGFSDQKTINVYSPPRESLPSDSDSTLYIVVSVVASVIVVAILMVAVVFLWRRFGGRRANITNSIKMADYKGEQGSHEHIFPWLEEWPRYENLQFDRLKLEVIGELGEGEFGAVYVAVATGILPTEETTRVAVKTLKGGSSRETAKDFRKELEIMMEFDHPNIIKLLGVCTTEEPLYLITELMDKGDLKMFVTGARPNEISPVPSLSLYELLDICSQVALGLAYLSSLKFIHRDIAARNCLVGGDDTELVVKVADFGMAKDVYQSDYYKKQGGVLPIRWMAPEAITDGRHTVKSDIWSFGVLMWEVFSFGYQPYFGVDNEVVLAGVIGGHMCLLCPPECPAIVYHLMKRCWERRPEGRVRASDLSQHIFGLGRLCKEKGSDAVKQLTADRCEELHVPGWSSTAAGAGNCYVFMSSATAMVDDDHLKPTAVVKTVEYVNVTEVSKSTEEPEHSYESVANNDYYVSANDNAVCNTSYLNMTETQDTAAREGVSKSSSQQDTAGALLRVRGEPRCQNVYVDMSQGEDFKPVNLLEVREDVGLSKTVGSRDLSGYVVPASNTEERHCTDTFATLPEVGIPKENYTSDVPQRITFAQPAAIGASVITAANKTPTDEGSPNLKD